MARQPKLTVTTPFGTFSRDTGRPYRWAAVAEHATHPEQGVTCAGAAKGDPELATSREYEYRVSPFDPNSEVRTHVTWNYFSRYLVRWSETREGAIRNAENYPYARVRVLGVYAVDPS
jgi:autonomous glycyl radical cofactor GrcA